MEHLRCPKTYSKLSLLPEYELIEDDVVNGFLRNETGQIYEINSGIPELILPEDIIGDALFARQYYKSIAQTYDSNVDITFKLYHEDELQSRNFMIDLLNLSPNSKVLEVSAGTGKDSELILKRLNRDGELFCVDISPDMLSYAKNRLSSFDNYTEAICASACALPFEDNTFDALYCFAGVGHFPSIEKGLAEMARVVKPNGKVVFSEKNVPLWLRETSYGKILINNNPMFAYDAPLKFIPKIARNVGIRWIIGNVHYVVDYTVADGEPSGNFDLELPGDRGGTFNTRYYGKIEGVTDETKMMVSKAHKIAGVSAHRWIDGILREAAKKILEKNNDDVE